MVGDRAVLSQPRRVPGCRGATAYAPQTAPRGRMMVMLWVVLLDDGWGYGHVFRIRNMFWLGIRICFRHLRVAFVGRMLLRLYTRYMPYMKIRPCFLNQRHISVGDTVMFSPSTGDVCGAYAIRPYTCYMPYIEIRICFPNRVYVSVRDTDMFSPPMGGVCGAYAIRPYTCYMPYIEIRTCFPYRVHITH